MAKCPLIAMILSEIFAENVATFRKMFDMTQEQLAHDAGIQRSYMNGIESGKRNPTLAVVESIADALNLEPETLLSLDILESNRKDYEDDK